MKKLVKENLGSILRPKVASDITSDIVRRLENKNIKTVKEGDNFTIYQIMSSSDIKDIVRNIGGKDDDIFFNFYLILDNDATGFNQIIGVKVGPEGNISAMDGKGNKVDTSYLEKFS